MGADFQQRYRHLKLVGEGAYQREYSALETAQQRPVMLLILDERKVGDLTALERFYRQVAALQKLDTPYIQQLYDTGHTDNAEPYVAVEPVTGQSLEQLCQARGPLPEGEVAALVAQVCQGLSVLHGAGLIHRNLHPGNLWVVEGSPPLVKMGGLSELRTPTSQITGAGASLATLPPYMAPEQIRLRGDVSRAVDFWALGVVLYELVFGTHPYERKLSRARTFDSGGITATDRVSAGLCSVMRTCLAVEPERRFYSALDLRDALVPLADRGLLPEELQLGKEAAQPDLPPSPGTPLFVSPEQQKDAGWSPAPRPAGNAPTGRAALTDRTVNVPADAAWPAPPTGEVSATERSTTQRIVPSDDSSNAPSPSSPAGPPAALPPAAPAPPSPPRRSSSPPRIVHDQLPGAVDREGQRLGWMVNLFIAAAVLFLLCTLGALVFVLWPK